jgi:hypothetical protein
MVMRKNRMLERRTASILGNRNLALPSPCIKRQSCTMMRQDIDGTLFDQTFFERQNNKNYFLIPLQHPQKPDVLLFGIL